MGFVAVFKKSQKNTEEANSKPFQNRIKEGFRKLKKVEENHEKMEKALSKLQFEKNLLVNLLKI